MRNELELSACALVPRHAVYAVAGCLAGAAYSRSV